MLISCYELGHQPLGIASAPGFLERAGYAPDALDIAVEGLDPEKVARARFVGISVPMHTALRLGVRVAEQVRRQRGRHRVPADMGGVHPVDKPRRLPRRPRVRRRGGAH